MPGQSRRNSLRRLPLRPDLLKITENLKVLLITVCLQNLPNFSTVTEKRPFHAGLAMFFDLGTSIQCKDASGNFPLHLAVQLREDSALECVWTLVDYGCHVNAVNYNGETALNVAVKECGFPYLQSEIVAELRRATFQNTLYSAWRREPLGGIRWILPPFSLLCWSCTSHGMRVILHLQLTGRTILPPAPLSAADE